mmetsp:Transcript_99413/g.179447  ORF Transcript_99413/g.179447 Transcript_99413/m.179447 type:complete len:118 (-) Transcript_99413:15-368(-)
MHVNCVIAEAAFGPPPQQTTTKTTNNNNIEFLQVTYLEPRRCCTDLGSLGTAPARVDGSHCWSCRYILQKRPPTQPGTACHCTSVQIFEPAPPAFLLLLAWLGLDSKHAARCPRQNL